MIWPVTTLGDPHLGKQFVVGVPLHRRGEREESLWADFTASVLGAPPGIHVCMGDLFDKTVVSYDDILRAAEVYATASRAKPETRFVVLRGNHDAMRTSDRASAFDVFAALMADNGCVLVAREIAELDDLLFVPWSTEPADEYMRRWLTDHPGRRYDTIYAHWDVDAWSTNSANLVPAEIVAQMTSHVVTGHVHTPQLRTIPTKSGDLQVRVTGSMQPLAHGEDPSGLRYVSRPWIEVQAELKYLGADTYHNCCLRVLAGPDDEIPGDLDCLQLQVVRNSGAGDEQETVAFEGDFSLPSLFAAVMAEAGIDPSVLSKITARLDLARISQ